MAEEFITKTTVGFTTQRFKKDTGECVNQEFVAGDQVEWEDESGESMIDPPSYYHNFDMVQPKETP